MYEIGSFPTTEPRSSLFTSGDEPKHTAQHEKQERPREPADIRLKKKERHTLLVSEAA
jgi:hypothetical protein